MKKQQEMIKSLGLSEVQYNRNKAAQYALDYSTASSPRNTKFAYYSSDCQNFGSQSVWYGFGGKDTQDAIDSKEFPMIDQGENDSRSWYQTSELNDCPSNWSWTGVEYFQDYMSNGGYQTIGPYGFEFSEVAYAQIGDIVQVDWDETGNWYDHTYIVVSVTGTYGSRTTSNIYVCEHSSRVNNVRLDQTPGTYFRTIKVGGYME